MKNFDQKLLIFTLVLIIIYGIMCYYKKIIPINRRLFSNLSTEKKNIQDEKTLSYNDKLYIFILNYIAYIIGIFIMIIYIQIIKKENNDNLLLHLIIIIILIIFELIIEHSYISTSINQFTNIALALTPFSQTILLILIGLLTPIITDENIIEKIKKINIYK